MPQLYSLVLLCFCVSGVSVFLVFLCYFVSVLLVLLVFLCYFVSGVTLFLRRTVFSKYQFLLRYVMLRSVFKNCVFVLWCISNRFIDSFLSKKDYRNIGVPFIDF